MTSVQDLYGYNAAWRATVDKASEDWRAYNEASALVRRFYASHTTLGREGAMRDFHDYLESLIAQHGAEHPRVTRLKNDFLLIGMVEGTRLRQEVRTTTALVTH
jgi:hypothetical protein